MTLEEFLTESIGNITPTQVAQAIAAADDAETSAALSQAWAESPTPPDPDDATSRSAKTIAETLGTLSELEALAERGEDAETGAVTAQGLAEAARDAASVNANVYPDIAAGRAAVADGEQFQVVVGDEIIRYRRDSDSTQTEVARYPASDFVFARLANAPGWRFALVDSEGFVLWGQDDEGNWHGVTDGDEGDFAFLDSLNSVDTSEGFAPVDDEGFVPAPARLTQSVLKSWCEPWRDPSKDLAITWFSNDINANVLRWGQEGNGMNMRSRAFYTRPMGVGIGGIYLHTALIEGLERLGAEPVIEYSPEGFTVSDKVKVCPQSGVRWIGLSDYHYAFTGPLENIAANVSGDVDFVVFNGDAADDHGRFSSQHVAGTAKLFLDIVHNYRTSGGAQVPICVTLGNHDGKGGLLGPTTAVAFNSGDGLPGPIPQFFVCGYHPTHPQRYDDSAYWIRIDHEMVMIFLNADHTVPIAEPRRVGQGQAPRIVPPGAEKTQLDWFRSVAHRYIPQCRTAYIVSHSGPFSTYAGVQWEQLETATMRLRYYPEIQDYPNVLGWLDGHQHKMQVFAPMVINYDDQMSWADNWYRYKAYDGEDRVVRCFGSGPSGGNWRGIPENFLTLESPIDSSGIFDVAVHNTGPATAPESTAGAVLVAVNAIGTIANLPGELWHGWVFEATSDTFTATCVGSDEPLIYQHQEAI